MPWAGLPTNLKNLVTRVGGPSFLPTFNLHGDTHNCIGGRGVIPQLACLGRRCFLFQGGESSRGGGGGGGVDWDGEGSVCVPFNFEGL